MVLSVSDLPLTFLNIVFLRKVGIFTRKNQVQISDLSNT